MSETNGTVIAIACQGGGSQTAFTAGVLKGILRRRPSEYEIGALSGTSGGAMCAAIAWDGLRRDDEAAAIAGLDGFWEDISARSPSDRFVNAWALWGRHVTSAFGSVAVSPYLNPLSVTAQRWLAETIERYVEFDDPRAPASPPHLFVGAVDVESGEFNLYADGEAGTSALLASAAIPTLFRAVEIEGKSHWDGLFSQNPPIRHFATEVPVDEKPDEIWIVRINPLRTTEVPRSMDGIADRRNELAGNLSLKQEKHTIQSVNEFIDEGVIDDERYKRIELREIGLDVNLDVESKFNRSSEFIRRLMELGEARAPEFWTRS